MLVQTTANQIIITIPEDNSYFSYSELKAFLNDLQYRSIFKQKQVPQSLADELADEADRNWWNNNKNRILNP